MIKYVLGDDGEMLPRSKSIDYYGLKIFYRFENRNNGLSVCLSFYDTWKEQTKPKKLFERIYIARDVEEGNEDSVLIRLIPKLLRTAFPAPSIGDSDGPQKQLRKECFPYMPLAVIAACDTDAIVHMNRWSEAYATEIRKAMDFLVEQYGRFRIEELKPLDISQALLRIPERKASNVIRAIHNLVLYENATGFHFDNPWDDYLKVYRQNRKTARKSGRRNTEINCLSDYEFFRTIKDVLLKFSRTKDVMWFAFLIYMTTPLSLEEICALTYRDFEFLQEYKNCLVVNVSQEYIKKEKNKRYSISPFESPYRKRIYPMPALVREAFQQLETKDSSRPLIHHPQNTARYCSPSTLRKYICDKIIVKRGGLVSACSSLTENISKLDVIVKETVQSGLMRCGFEDDELSYMYGKKPGSTSGFYYCDFGAEGELNRLSLLQDRWLGDYEHYICDVFRDPGFDLAKTEPEATQSLMEGKPLYLYAQRGKLFSANVRLCIKADQSMSRPVALLVRSSRGFIATIQLEKTNG